MHQGPAVGGGDENLARARLAVRIGILAGFVDVEAVMGVFQRRNRKAARVEGGNELDDQGGLSRPAPSRKADHAHDEKASRVRPCGDSALRPRAQTFALPLELCRRIA